MQKAKVTGECQILRDLRIILIVYLVLNVLGGLFFFFVPDQVANDIFEPIQTSALLRRAFAAALFAIAFAEGYAVFEYEVSEQFVLVVSLHVVWYIVNFVSFLIEIIRLDSNDNNVPVLVIIMCVLFFLQSVLSGIYLYILRDLIKSKTKKEKSTTFDVRSMQVRPQPVTKTTTKTTTTRRNQIREENVSPYTSTMALNATRAPITRVLTWAEYMEGIQGPTNNNSTRNV